MFRLSAAVMRRVAVALTVLALAGAAYAQSLTRGSFTDGSLGPKVATSGTVTPVYLTTTGGVILTTAGGAILTTTGN